MKIILLFLLSINILLANNNITSIGYGKSKSEALNNAFVNAISQYVGVVIDSKTIIKNNKLIERKILSFSDGYIENYNILSSKNTTTALWEVKIEAEVNKQAILTKVNKLKIKNQQVENSDLVYATLHSNIKTKFDAEDMLKKTFMTLNSQKTIESLVTFSVDSFDVDIESATRTTVPCKITYSVYFDLKSYDKLANELGNLFIKLGAILENSYKIDNEEYLVNPDFKLGNNIFIVKKNLDYGFYAYEYSFSESYKMIYPFKDKNWNDLSLRREYKLFFLDNKNRQIFSKDYTYNHKFFEYINTKQLLSFRKSYIHYQGNSLAIVPILTKDTSNKTLKIYSITEHLDLPIKTVENLQQIQIKWISK